MSTTRYVPLIISVLLVLGVVAYALTSVPASSVPSNVTLRVGYPDSLDETDVPDIWAYSHILAAEGITVVPTFYDAPSLAYKGLLSGQQDIALINSGLEFIGASQGAQTTIVTSYSLAGTFLMIVGEDITSPSQLVGKTVDDFGPGSAGRALNLYWFNQAGLKVNLEAPAPDSVYLRAAGGNVARIHDLQTGVAQATTIDDFMITAVQDPAVNDTAHHGPFHVLFYAPDDVVNVPYAVRDDWLSVPANQEVLVKWIAAIIQAQRWFISNTQQAISFVQSQLPLTPLDEINFATIFYPAHYTYWPYGALNLQGALQVDALMKNTNDFQLAAGNIAGPISNSSVTPYGVLNGEFELQALMNLGPYQYPCQSWVDPAFISNLNSWVPQTFGSAPSNCVASAIGAAQGSLQSSVSLPQFQLIISRLRRV